LAGRWNSEHRDCRKKPYLEKSRGARGVGIIWSGTGCKPSVQAAHGHGPWHPRAGKLLLSECDCKTAALVAFASEGDSSWSISIAFDNLSRRLKRSESACRRPIHPPTIRWPLALAPESTTMKLAVREGEASPCSGSARWQSKHARRLNSR